MASRLEIPLMAKGTPRMALGLTGGMGGGKSTVRAIFEAAGWAGMDADSIVRDLLANDFRVQAEIREHFGPEVLKSPGSGQGGIDRKALATLVFRDADALSWLEGLLHPRVRETWTAFLEHEPNPLRIVEIPLLFEKNLEKHFDYTVCIETQPELQLERLAAKGIAREQALPRIQHQMPIEEKVRRADFVLSNNGAQTFLRQQTQNLIEALSAVACGMSKSS